jgi:hypothetical protein
MRIVNDEEAATGVSEDAVTCEPAQDGDREVDRPPEPAIDDYCWTPEEEGYGYGV